MNENLSRAIASKSSAIDFEAGLKNCADDEELFQQMLSDFVSDHSGDYDKIKAALDEGESKTAQRLAHTLKSTATLIGAKDLASAALVIELAASKDYLIDWSLMDDLKDECQRVNKELKRMTVR
ncbi:MAG: Hpt domain-containing protein [Clostridiales bacterium]|nr:Hpt domain-containing protein [Clostridiales bacterium]